MCEGYFKSHIRAVTACKLIIKYKDNENVEAMDCIEAAKGSPHMEQCERYLNHECKICFDNYPMNKVLCIYFIVVFCIFHVIKFCFAIKNAPKMS